MDGSRPHPFHTSSRFSHVLSRTLTTVVIPNLLLQLIALGSAIRFAAWIILQFRRFDRLKQTLNWLLVVLSFVILSISAVRIGLNPSAVPVAAGAISGSLALLGIGLQWVLHSPDSNPNTPLQNSLRWLWGTWAIASVVFVPLLLWSSFIQTGQTLGLLIGQGVSVLIVGAIIVGTIMLLNTFDYVGMGMAIFLIPIAAGGLLLAFNVGLGWLYLGQTLTSWLMPTELDNLVWCLSAIFLPPMVQVGGAIALQWIAPSPQQTPPKTASLQIPSTNLARAPIQLDQWIQKGDIGQIRSWLRTQLLSQDQAMNIAQKGLKTAIIQKNPKIASLFLEHGVSANPSDPNAMSPLCLAINCAQWDVVQLLLDHGADSNGKGLNNRTALIRALEVKNWDLAQQLLENGADPNLGSPTPLLVAVKHGQIELARQLIEAGADPNQGSDTETPLQHAIEHQDFAGVADLLAAGADPNLRMRQSQSPLQLACRRNHLQLLQLLLDYGAEPDANGLAIAAENNNQDMLEFFCGMGINPEERSAQQAIFHAAKHNNFQNVLLLLKAGISPNYRYRGSTPLAEAVKHSNLSLVSLLIRYGAVPNETQFDSYPPDIPLLIAIKNNHYNMVRFLLKRGADPNFKGCDRNSPLQQAHWQSNQEMVALLMEYEAT